MRTIFLNENGQLRSGWRAAIFLFSFISVAIVIDTLGEIGLDTLGIDAASGPALFLIATGILSLIGALVNGWLCGQILEGLPFRSIGAAFTKDWFQHWVAGLLLGAATLGFAVLIAVIFGGLRFHFDSDQGTNIIVTSLAVSFIVFAVRSAFEEAFFRGYLLQTLARANLAWVAILLTSLFFGAVHLRNPNANVISTLNTILAGIWFGVAYLKTRDLWFVWGIHLMWNWMQGSFFGIEVSGLTNVTAAPLFKEIDAGPAWLTGQTYGVEGGVVCTIALVVSTALIYFQPYLKPDEELLAMTSPPTPSVS